MSYREEPLSAVEQELKAQGFWCYRGHFRWGKTPAYRNEAGQYRFVEAGRALPPWQMLQVLLNDWIPQRSDDVLFYEWSMANEFNAMRQD